RMIQGIELFVHEEEESPVFKIDIPVIYEEKFNKPGSMRSLIKAFQITKQIKENEQDTKENEQDTQENDKSI
ncbi:MAG: hypothetical protein R3255_00270, partial [Candidatus Lokiarchaeia archaeon]|nr:hypothetical protein [Candidatus Lokiarchaeia archaeon]